ncbi:PEP-CTERM sorting domain-containing protein [Sedimentisphaera salicampi]|uniref:PEP-CTERM sorting domain-containing protein n=1 Tax=Sedimentisphaera salicampi TaxID=1941349 RepID=UPI000B9C09C0|nr:PEP-CTERM sorting domain-containing protein [Sedimentisphaera salicampi]OXU15009.1 hypothetical protein SMSP1_01202 [Sedimentisphaera salicampi]
MKKIIKKTGVVILLAVVALLCNVAHAEYTNIELDFGNQEAAGFPGQANPLIEFGDVAKSGSSIYATLEADDPWTSNNTANQGSEDGNIIVNAQNGETVNLTLSLWNDADYTTAFDPGESYKWSLGFYDIDGTSSGTADILTLKTAGTYTVTQNTFLAVDNTDPAAPIFDGGNQEVTEPSDISNLTGDQANVAVLYTLYDIPSVEFTYQVTETSGDVGRTLFVDGGDLAFGDGVVTEDVTIPEPATMALLGIGGLFSIRRKRSS